ncbi:MAG: 4-hydroxythreonine-4-phosphate dehydrogenase PdxA [Ferrovibrionaceae bacterium]
MAVAIVRPRPAAPLALTMGDPAGIGAEIALKAWSDRARHGLPPFFLIDDPARLAAMAPDTPLRQIVEPEDAANAFADALPVLPVSLPCPATAGQPDPRNAPAVIAAIDRATDLALAGRVGAVVTNPIAKAVLYEAGFRHPGHTEYIAERCGAIGTMMLMVPELRVVLVTIHEPLARAVAGLTTEAIVATARVAAHGLAQDFGLARPRLAIAGLNPHAGENGGIGREDIEIVAPAVARLQAEGIEARGPVPPDTMFHAAARQTYDAAICLYHDQGLIPLKTLDFDRGVNVTLGLPIVRTSPDHGTAFDIAGKGIARPDSLIAAIRAAAAIADVRRRARIDDRD